MRSILIILFFTLMFLSAKTKAQKWQPGHYTDVKGVIQTGLIKVDPKKNGPVKNEGFIEYKPDKKSNSVKINAGGIRSLVIGRDSFIVAHAPVHQFWPVNETDFVDVVLDEDTKLYAPYTDSRGGRGSGLSGFSIGIGGGTGFGTRNFGFGVGGGVEVPLGSRTYDGGPVYYYGETPAEMKILTNDNFADVMTDIMGDYPDLVNEIQRRVYGLGNIDKLIARFNQLKAKDTSK